MSITNAQMMAYNAAMRRDYKIPGSTWILMAAIALMTLLLLFVVALIIVKNIEVNNSISRIHEDARKKQAIAMYIEQGATHFANKQWEQALNTFKALERDAQDNPLINEYPIIPLYISQIPVEQERNNKLTDAYNKIKDPTSKLPVYEDVLNYLNQIPNDSMFYHEVQTQRLPQIQTAYISLLRQDIQKAIQAKKFDDAKLLLPAFDRVASARADKLNFSEIIRVAETR